MKELWAKLKEWWSHLAPREKQVTSIGASLVILFIVYQWIWTPYLEGVDTMRHRITADQKTLLWMQAADKQIQTLEVQGKAKTKSVSPVVLLSQIQKQVNRSGLEQYLTQLKQTTNEAIEVHFQKVEFDKLITMLAKIMKEQDVSITRLSLIATDAPGYVNADMVMKQS